MVSQQADTRQEKVVTDPQVILRLASDDCEHFCRVLASVLVTVSSDGDIKLTDETEQELATLLGQVGQLQGKVAKTLRKISAMQ